MGLATGIIGAAGYAGAELVRILSRHPEFDLRVITSSTDEGVAIADLYPAFKGVCDLEFEAHNTATLADCDVVFMATPHTAAMALVPDLLASDVSVFDLSADFRLKDPAIFEQWYGTPHTQTELLEHAFFGLPEITEAALLEARKLHAQHHPTLVACAGCYPTATSLAAYPAVELTEGIVVVDAISGVSGAGRSATPRTHFCNANNNFEAYGVASHRHTPEIEQILGLQDRLVFTPHLAPANRGLLSTVTMQLSAGAREEHTLETLHALYEATYNEDYPFVTVLPLGQMPRTASVVGTNNAHIGIAFQKTTGTLIAVCAIDNLCKGAAGQAVQCANIVCGFEQRCGLDLVAMPV
ncbi:N-acetyl-gamma-glutamyl-phosphate reductase [Anaerotardibacter muris]|uniref:N-acetyl-gamma-glutamyl-phosphate reductase n=1 Tax=Anaerotardibacter muris TaxID=2941505 RepID=UPI002040081E|nr:N-acetyl-gamma-glutamyl-phosphate reductase [Anaerotardibacter muris]